MIDRKVVKTSGEIKQNNVITVSCIFNRIDFKAKILKISLHLYTF